MNIQKLIIEDVRCFAGRQEFNIRPLTFLVGENSTGKSTALGCFETLDKFMNNRPHGLDFNIEPYQMGAFTDIVRRSNPRKKWFRLGFSFQDAQGSMDYILDCAERETGSEPTVSGEKFVFENTEIVVKETSQPIDFPNFSNVSFKSIRITSENTNRIKKFTVEVGPLATRWSAFGLLSIVLVKTQKDDELSADDVELRNFLEPLLPLLLEADSSLGTHSFAPIRSKPQRTYNPLKEAVSAEGSDMPMLLMNMSKTSKQPWQELRHHLIKFGKASGLFGDIDVRRLGKSTSDPFQLQIKVKGPRVNLIDVGYGVNQILPILVRIFNMRQRTTFLMQQPEVHLHPRGQAELSSLLTALVQQRDHSFIIETHSDHMVDRARIEIMKKRISPEDVSLIYLEPVGNSVKVHNIAFDEQANLIGAPGSYREFFLKESDKLLGFA